jgi:SpoVK/Ycf46/Vps4 family AAA+-type ATPase
LDPAVKRGGRIDHIIGVGPPQKKARLRIIRSTLNSSVATGLFDVLTEELASVTDRLTRSEIRRACKLLARSKSLITEDDARQAAHAVADRIKNASTITREEYDGFKSAKKDFSRPVTEGGATDV